MTNGLAFDLWAALAFVCVFGALMGAGWLYDHHGHSEAHDAALTDQGHVTIVVVPKDWEESGWA